MDDVRSYLDPTVVAQLANMELRARFVVEGFITGLHRSPYHGFSVEFAQHRPYMAGDELRHIDWKAYGKTDKYFIKQFEEETNLKSYLVLDASRSMAFTSGSRPTKFAYASYVAAALAYLMMEQRDAVGLSLYDKDVRASLTPRSTRPSLMQLLAELERAVPGEGTETAKALHSVAERLTRRGLVIVLSDFFDDPERVITALRHFRHKGNEVIVMQILDPLERSFAFEQDAIFQDMETGEKLMTQPWHLSRAYQETMREFLKTLKLRCLENGIDYVLLDTATPFDRALLEYLNKRARLH